MMEKEGKYAGDIFHKILQCRQQDGITRLVCWIGAKKGIQYAPYHVSRLIKFK
jgi:hypothetical protein